MGRYVQRMFGFASRCRSKIFHCLEISRLAAKTASLDSLARVTICTSAIWPVSVSRLMFQAVDHPEIPVRTCHWRRRCYRNIIEMLWKLMSTVGIDASEFSEKALFSVDDLLFINYGTRAAITAQGFVSPIVIAPATSPAPPGFF